MSLPSLPTELQLQIISHLSFFDKHSLSLISPHFRNLIPPPTYEELLAYEQSTVTSETCCENEYCHRLKNWRQGDWATWPVCKQLRPRTKFGTYGEEIWSRTTYLYLCLECGTRPLPGEFRYKKGDIWQAGELEMIRCPVCDDCGETLRTGVKGSKHVNTARDKCRKFYTKDQTQSPKSGTR